MTPITLDAEPACPGTEPAVGASETNAALALHVERRRVTDIAQEAWDALAARTPWATPWVESTAAIDAGVRANLQVALGGRLRRYLRPARRL